MSSTNRLKIFNDPIYGFIGIPNELIYKLLEHPYFQRLRRISQMGLSYLVYPGAHHTRFHHALGSMHLMREAIAQLRFKKINITDAEEQGLLAAILLHDIGHGPFSHALEGQLVQGVSHEELSLSFMKELNNQMDGQLDLAISIFQGTHHKKYLNQLVSSQLDMDRLDYLKRDSFFTGVTEGNISSQRLLSMLNVAQGELVVEEKGIYSVEKFLMARRFMYWQVYLHKTSLVAELLMTTIIKRAKELLISGVQLEGSKTLRRFLSKKESAAFSSEDLEAFSKLDDFDIVSAIKSWQLQEDKVLSKLSQMLLDRNLPKIKMKNDPIGSEKLSSIATKLKLDLGLTTNELPYFLFHGEVSNRAYNLKSQNINILRKNGKITDVAKASDHLNLKALAKRVTKYYVAYPTKAV